MKSTSTTHILEMSVYISAMRIAIAGSARPKMCTAPTFIGGDKMLVVIIMFH